MSTLPPKNALKFLRWFCREDYIEEIEGDLIELFESRSDHSPKNAKRSFIWDVIKSFRWRNLKSTSISLNQGIMYKNYIKIALRIFQREKAFTFINVLGLAAGLAITLLIVQYVRFERSYEDSHVHVDRLVRLTTDYMDGETLSSQDCETYPPIGPKILAELPEVVDFARVYPIGEPTINLQIGDQHYIQDKAFAADASYFSIFTSPLLYGTVENIFTQPRQIVLTASMARKYFDRENVVGEVIKMPVFKGEIPLKIVGVVADSPPNTHLKVNVLISYPTLLAEKAFGEKEENWNGNNTLTYVLLAPNTDYDVFTTSLANFSQRLIDEKKMKNDRVVGQKIADIHLYSKKIFETEPNGDATTVLFLLGVAFLVIISAFVNYINLTTSQALDRAKEVGIRKVVGSTKSQLRTQFLTESLLINLFAGAFAIIFIAYFKGKFIEVAGLPEEFMIFYDPFFWQLLGGFIVLGVLLSGVYPAFVLSSFKPTSVLKGSFGHSTKGVFLRKSLVVFQFAITIILLVQTVTVYEQLQYMRNIDLGVDIEQTIVVKAPAQLNARQNYSLFKEKLLERADVQSVSLSMSVPGLPTSHFSTTTGINLSEAIEEHSYNFYLTNIDSDYIPLMGMELLAGKNFEPTAKREHQEVIVNEEALRLWGITDPKDAIGKNLSFWGRTWPIRGVVKNYHQESAKSAHIPIIHQFAPMFSSLASIKFSGGNPKEQVAEVQEIYESQFPSSPFSYFFMDGEYDKQFKADEQFQDVFSVLTGFAILIACLGLFGLASFTVSKRTKEIGIRKVIGASTANILVLLSKDFVNTIVISMFIGIPVTFWLVSTWLENFAYRIELKWWLFAAPAMLVLMLGLFSLSFKTVKTALANPIDSLRDE